MYASNASPFTGPRGMSDFLCFGPAAAGHWPNRFLERNQLIRRKLLECFTEPAGPMDLDVNATARPQAEMQTWVVAGKVAGLAHHRLRLGLISVMDENPGSNGTAIGLYALQFHLDPMIRAAEVIA